MRKPVNNHLARSVSEALVASDTLTSLLGSHRRANACMALVSASLAPALRGQMRPGPVEDGTWTILANHGGAAAKLRQALPTLLEALAAGGENITEIRVKVLPLGANPDPYSPK